MYAGEKLMLHRHFSSTPEFAVNVLCQCPITPGPRVTVNVLKSHHYFMTLSAE